MIWSETTVTAPDGTLLWTQKRSICARGEGGFGDERGPSTSSEPPSRAADFELAIPVSPQQALLYRMCGDRNPLHSDPEFAATAGFPRPLLHGLCTYGMTCKAMVDTLLALRALSRCQPVVAHNSSRIRLSPALSARRYRVAIVFVMPSSTAPSSGPMAPHQDRRFDTARAFSDEATNSVTRAFLMSQRVRWRT